MVKLFLFIFLFSSIHILPAQQSDFFIETRFVQRLTWTAIDHILHYEVEIQRQQGAVFTSVLNETTLETFIEISLPAGSYRYRITPYDLFNRPGRSTDWANFTIHPALTAEVHSFSPEKFTLSDTQSEYVLEITGNNFLEDSVISIRRAGDINPIMPQRVQIRQNGTNALLYFNREQLETGIYLIHIKNPGGMESNKGDFIIEHKQPTVLFDHPLEIYWLACWMPVIPIYHSEKYLFDESVSLAGAAMRIGALTTDADYFNYGLELAATWYAANALVDNAEADLQTITIGLNFLFRIYLPKNTSALTFRLGPGYTLLSGLQDTGLSAIELINTTAGFSFLCLFSESLFFELGIDHVNYFTANFSGALRPWLGIGMKR